MTGAALDRSKIVVLIADDEPENSQAFARALRGYDVRLALRGDQAMSMMAEQGVDIVIADQCMPGTTGALVLERARAINSLVRRVIVSASAQPSDLLEAINHGEVERYLLKPIAPDELRSTVDHLAIDYLKARQLKLHIAELEDQIQLLKRTPVAAPAGWDRLELEVARARRYGRPLSIVVVDEGSLDHAHARIGGELREVDLVVPMGRKLVLALPETGAAEASLVIARLQTSFTQCAFSIVTFPDVQGDLTTLLAAVRLVER